MFKAIQLATSSIVITLLSAGIGAAHADPLKVVASFSIIGDFAKNIGGDRVDLTTLVGPDSDAHVYEPKPADAVAMAGAQLVLVNGLHFEGFLQRLVESSASKATIIELTKGVEPLHAHEEESHDHKGESDHHGHDHGDIDPHAFQSISNVRIYVKNIADAFCAADAEGCEVYRSNAEAYEKKLSEAESQIKSAVASIPQDKRTVITSHDAFGYFAREYGITFLAPEGVSTDAEASAADVAALIKQVREDKASAIFVENITNARLVEQIASETGLKIGGTLYSDALSDASGPASTYIDMMLHNIDTIKDATLGS